MTYTHLTTNELTIIESYVNTQKDKLNMTALARMLHRSRQTIYTVVRYFKQGHTSLDYIHQYQQNKSRCGRKPTHLSNEELEYIRTQVAAGWNPDVIVHRKEFPISCSARTLYRLFERGILDVQTLAMKGKRKKNHQQEKRGKQPFVRSIHERNELFPNHKQEFGHIEGDTIVGAHHKSAAITLVECFSKLIITLKTEGRKSSDITTALHQWLGNLPSHFIKSMTFDNGKEFADWKSICNQHDVHIFFADPGCPSQRGLNEHSNGLLRRDGLHKGIDFTNLSQEFLSAISSRRNHIPRKSLNYQTPVEVFLSCLNDELLSNLI